MRRRTILFLLSLVAAVSFLGCGGGTTGANGTLRLMLADAPLPNVTSLVVTIDRIEAHVDGQWTDVATDPQTIDLLDLTQQAMVAGSVGMPPGSVNQVRLFVSSAVVTDETGTHDVNIPSNLQTGIKVNIDAPVEAGTVTGILLDFNVEKSLHQLGNGNYQLQPVIPAVLVKLSGTVSGSVTLDGAPVHGALVRAIYTAGPNYALGTEVNTSATAEDGTFKVWALREGTYTIEVAFTDASSANFVASVTDVVVVREQDTNVGAIALTPAP